MSPSDGDAELLRRWREGDGDSGNALFERHFRAVFRFFRAKLDESVAEDLAQQTFLAMVAGRDRVGEEQGFRPYLFGIARKTLLMHLRTRMRAAPTVDLGASAIADLQVSAATRIAVASEQELLARALRRLPLDFQIAVELYYWEGLSTVAIAEVLEVPEGTVRSRLTRARSQLAEHIAAIAETPELARSTLEGLDAWVASLSRALADAP
jgi:RNA polymerase sigma-70 factor (ECF subfamily)